MANPYAILSVTPADGDEAIRQRYLEAVRRFPPERCPDEFKRVRNAYELIKDVRSRLAFLLFEPSQGETLDELLEEEKCRNVPRRMGLTTLLRLLDQAR
ncbi:MAG TPA: J domain-containing protein [Phycisphaerae bacterium]|nr:J domain-containing protein [Phycisphaerae bacterium]